MLDGSTVRAGDVLVGLPSTGLHSNGYSLARKVLVDSGRFDLSEPAGEVTEPLGDALLTPTHIYVKELRTLRDHGLKAAAHITGGGIPGNLPRVLPNGVGARIDRSCWHLPAIFSLLQREGALTDRDLLRTFNCGLGIIAVLPADQAAAAAEAVGGCIIGEITSTSGVEWA